LGIIVFIGPCVKLPLMSWEALLRFKKQSADSRGRAGRSKAARRVGRRAEGYLIVLEEKLELEAEDDSTFVSGRLGETEGRTVRAATEHAVIDGLTTAAVE